MARGYGYSHGYRGRQGTSPFLRGLVIFLAVLLVLSVLLLIYLSRYLQYTDEGPRLALPWLSEQGEDRDGPDLSDLVIENDGQDPPEDGADEPAAREPVLKALQALEVSASAVADGTARLLAEEAGADALVVRVKDEEGNLAFHTLTELAQESMNGDSGFNTAVGELAREGKLYLTARLSGFQDLWTSVYVRETAITYPSGSLWYDRSGISWMSLSNQRARSYLTELCVTLADMGFDEILLEHAGYPDQGRVGGIGVNSNYPSEGRDAQAAAFLRELSGKLEESGAVLSVQPYEQAPAEDAVSGVTPAALSGVSGRIWLPKGADLDGWTEALTGAGMADAPLRLVTAEPPEQGGWQGSVLLGG